MLLARKYPTDVFANLSTIHKPLWLVKVLSFEYWPLWLFYLPLVPYIIWLIIKSRSITFYKYANPSIESGGLSGESKKKILDNIAERYKPKTLLFSCQNSLFYVVSEIEKQNISYPFIAKPNVGEQGKGVEKIHNKEELEHYLSTNNDTDFIIQEYVDFPVELGVFYVRKPNHLRGNITSITQKKFLSVTGNGHSTVEELMSANDRARFQLKRIKEKLQCNIDYIPYYGEEIVLEHIGNHCRGTMFVNANHLINKKLNETFDKISTTIPGFYYGRFDLRVSSIEDLYRGENIRIVELNGVGSIPGHIFDPSYKLLDAWKDVIQHWKVAGEIAELNKRKNQL